MNAREKAFRIFGLMRTEISLLHDSELLKDKIDLLPDKITSSKKIMMCLNINSRYEYDIFKKVYLDYFKLKLINKN